jgi:hypothetical protein
MLATGDLNGDRHADLVSANATEHQFTVLLGDGRGNLILTQSLRTGFFPLAVDLGDLDGDSDLDVVISSFSRDWRIFENDGTGNLTLNATYPASRAGSCAVLHDRDRDGDLDMTGVDEEHDVIVLFENPGPATTTPSQEPAQISQTFNLMQSYPNPFSKSSAQAAGRHMIKVPFELQRTMATKIELVNIRGQRLSLLTQRIYARGHHNVSIDPQDLTAGIYYYRITTPAGTKSRKMLIIP